MNYIYYIKEQGYFHHTCLFGTSEYLLCSKYDFPIKLGSHLISLALEIKNCIENSNTALMVVDQWLGSRLRERSQHQSDSQLHDIGRWILQL